MVYKGSETLSPNSLRQGLLDDGWLPFALWRRWRDSATLLNAGWHCSSCFATLDEMRTRLHSLSHENWDTAENRNAGVMISRVREGKDLFGREGEVYDTVDPSDVNAPSYILEQNEAMGRFGYLLNRDGEDAGFEDRQSVSQEA